MSRSRSAEQALRESEAFLRLSQSVGQVGSWQWDLNTNQVRWSEAMFPLYGMRPEEFDGTLAGTIRTTHPDDLPGVQVVIERILNQGEACPIEFRVIKEDGRIAHLFGHGEVLHDDAGRPAQVIGTVADITEHKLAAEAQRAARPASGRCSSIRQTRSLLRTFKAQSWM